MVLMRSFYLFSSLTEQPSCTKFPKLPDIFLEIVRSIRKFGLIPTSLTDCRATDPMWGIYVPIVNTGLILLVQGYPLTGLGLRE